MQVQCIMHIIINRIALIMCDVRRVRMLKYVVTVLIGIINIVSFQDTSTGSALRTMGRDTYTYC